MKEHQFCFSYSFEIGNITIVDDGLGICDVSFEKIDHIVERETPLIKKTAKELREYFSGKRKIFTITLSINGTEFQKKVWNELQQIPYGETKSYSEIAALVNNPGASRAVGMANNKNRIAILIPCHRVIGKNKRLTGYAGGLEIKQFLLDLEKNYSI